MSLAEDDPLYEPPGPKRDKPTRGRMPRNTDLFAPVCLSWLTDRRHDCLFPGPVRLYLYLVIKSRGGQNPVRLTNEMTAEIGIARTWKLKCLSRLQSWGYISVEQEANVAPLVTVLGVA